LKRVEQKDIEMDMLKVFVSVKQKVVVNPMIMDISKDTVMDN
jgi:hypothetical protein